MALRETEIDYLDTPTALKIYNARAVRFYRPLTAHRHREINKRNANYEPKLLSLRIYRGMCGRIEDFVGALN
jgi:hypothetical protein